MHMYIPVYTYAYVYTHMHKSIDIRTYIHRFFYICTYVTHVYMYTHSENTQGDTFFFL